MKMMKVNSATPMQGVRGNLLQDVAGEDSHNRLVYRKGSFGC